MEGLQPLRSLRQTAQERFQHVLGQRFFHDRLSLALMITSLAVDAGNLIILALRVHPTDNQVPVHFSSFTLFDRLGPWYFPFEIALVVTVLTVANVVFAYQSFLRSRLASFFLLVTAVVVALFGFIIAQAFGAVR